VGAVILDETSQIIRLAQFHAPFLEQEMRCTLKPRAIVADGAVWVERTGGRLRLGKYNANVIAVETEGMVCRLLHLSGAASQIPPEKEEGLATRQLQTEDEAFLNRQDRLVLGFTAQADPQEIESYLAQGGYAAVKRVLGLSGEPALGCAEIIAEVAEPDCAVVGVRGSRPVASGGGVSGEEYCSGVGREPERHKTHCRQRG